MEELIIMFMGIIIATAIIVVSYFLLVRHKHKTKQNDKQDDKKDNKKDDKQDNKKDNKGDAQQRNPTSNYYQQQGGALFNHRLRSIPQVDDPNIMTPPYILARKSDNQVLNANFDTPVLHSRNDFKNILNDHLGLF